MKNILNHGSLIAAAALFVGVAKAAPEVIIESADTADGFKQLRVPPAPSYGQPGFGRKVSSNHKVTNEPLHSLTDCLLYTSDAADD